MAYIQGTCGDSVILFYQTKQDHSEVLVYCARE